MNKKTVIDFHHHLLGEKDYADKLINKMDEVGINITCLSGLGIGKGHDKYSLDKFNLGSLSPDNDDVLDVIKKYPKRLIGFGVINLGKDNPEKVRNLYNLGFKGVKVTRPLKNYNDDEYLSIYNEADKLGMPVLFHTGMVLVTPYDAEDDVCNDRMRPILVDRIARRFPKLKIIIAHLGVPWFEEATILARFHENIFVDLTGASLGWRNRLSPNDYQKLFFWENAFKKIVFGTDVHANQINDVYHDQARLFDLLNLNEETQAAIFSGNAVQFLKLQNID